MFRTRTVQRVASLIGATLLSARPLSAHGKLITVDMELDTLGWVGEFTIDDTTGAPPEPRSFLPTPSRSSS